MLMVIDQKKLYRFPWSMTDNPGGWVEMTDLCNLSCPGCYRQRLEGHRPLEDVLADIAACKKITNCDCMKISGGEPLTYPHIIEVIDFISKNGMKPLILTNGLSLDKSLLRAMEKAGLKRINFHIDSAQNRPGWEGKKETELNELRQYYVDLVGGFREVCCGFNTTVSRSNLDEIPDIVEWTMKNIHKVRHLALIALRGLPVSGGIEYCANATKVDPGGIRTSFMNTEEISISAEELYAIIEEHFPHSHPSAYLNGTAAPETYKVLVIPYLGSKHAIYGTVGARTIEFTQTMYHLIKGRYNLGLRKLDVGRKIFLLSLLDHEIRKSFAKYLKAGIRNPLRLLSRIYVQTIQIQQPREIVNGEINLCDGCLNQMVYKDRIINSCQLDEYRMYGSPLIPIRSRCHPL